MANIRISSGFLPSTVTWICICRLFFIGDFRKHHELFAFESRCGGDLDLDLPNRIRAPADQRELFYALQVEVDSHEAISHLIVHFNEVELFLNRFVMAGELCSDSPGEKTGADEVTDAGVAETIIDPRDQLLFSEPLDPLVRISKLKQRTFQRQQQMKQFPVRRIGDRDQTWNLRF